MLEDGFTNLYMYNYILDGTQGALSKSSLSI